MKYLTQKFCIGTQCVEGPLPTGTGPGTINTVGDLINRLMTFLIPLTVIILFFVLVWGGVGFLTSKGSPEKIKSATAKITAGVIGFVLFLLAFLITRVLSNIFGIGQGILGP